MKPIENDFSERLRDARARLRMSQKVLSKTLGVSSTTYSSWEVGRTIPNGVMLSGLCSLGINGHWLLTGEGPVLMTDAMANRGHVNGRSPIEGTKEIEVPPKTTSETSKENYRQAAVNLVEDLGLWPFLAWARNDDKEQLWMILLSLDSQGPKTSTELVGILNNRGFEVTDGFITQLLESARVEGLIELGRTGWQLQPSVVPTNPTLMYVPEILRLAVKALSQNVMVTCLKDRRSGWFGVIRGKTTIGTTRKNLPELRKLIIDWAEECEDPAGSEIFELVVGVAPQS